MADLYTLVDLNLYDGVKIICMHHYLVPRTVTWMGGYIRLLLLIRSKIKLLNA